MPLITNERQVLFLVRILFQWELDESIRLHVLLLLLYRELLHVLLDVKQIVDLFLSFLFLERTLRGNLHYSKE